MCAAAGRLCGEAAAFTRGRLLSRPSGLCFDGAGDLYVTHMGGQVLHAAAHAAGPRLCFFAECRQF